LIKELEVLIQSTASSECLVSVVWQLFRLSLTHNTSAYFLLAVLVAAPAIVRWDGLSFVG